MRGIALGAALSLIAATAQACPMSLALYADTATRTELRIRTPASWESDGMSTYVIELMLNDGRLLWGGIGQNMGTSRDVGRLYWGCDRPGPQEAPLTEQAAADCLVWEGVVYGLQDGVVSALPLPEEKAPNSLILTDLGRKLRYAVFDSPGEEPWDQFKLSACAE